MQGLVVREIQRLNLDRLFLIFTRLASTLSELSPCRNRTLYNPAHARNTLEHNYAGLVVAHLGLLKRWTGSAISAT